MQTQSSAPPTRLPDNAYTPLLPGTTYQPVVPAADAIAELTPRSVGWGLFLCVDLHHRLAPTPASRSAR